MSAENVSDDELSPSSETCPLCGSTTSTATGVLLQTLPDVEVRSCSRCHADFADRMPSSAFLESLYAPDEYTPDLNHNPNAVARLARSIVADLGDLGMLDGSSPLRMLDFGGADGTLLRQVELALPASVDRSQCRFVVADLFPQELEAPLEYCLADDITTICPQYDVILASAVIEHLREPATVLAQLSDAVRPGGLFYGRTPWDMPFVRLLRNYSLRWPRHLLDLGPDFWSNAGSTAMPGFTHERGSTSAPDSDLRNAPSRTTAAWICKTLGRVEALGPQRVLGYSSPKWTYQGSWEAWLRKTG